MTDHKRTNSTLRAMLTRRDKKIAALTAEVERLRNAMVVMDNTVRELTEATHMAMLELGSHGACPACFNAHSTLRNALTEPEGLK